MALTLVGCGGGGQADSNNATVNLAMREEGERYLRLNQSRPGVASWGSGEQFEVLDAGKGDKLTSDDVFVGLWRRTDFSWTPINDGTGMLTIRKVSDFSLPALSYGLTKVGVGGKVRVSIPWNRKGMGEFVSDKGPIFPDETVVWEFTVLKKSSPEERKAFLDHSYTETASALVFNVCDGGVPDLLTEGSWSIGDRGVLDPYNFAVKREDTVPIRLVSSYQRSVDKGGVERPRWEWVGPCTGIFVLPGITECDPAQIGEFIYGSGTGGQDWVGSYQAMSLLDRDANGWVDGEELREVSVWVDTNTDGKPDLGEVRRSADFIDKINIRPTRVSRTDFMISGVGVIFQDGSTASSWDWATRGID